jgi:dTDP-4-amino-4,6-dideoxygalactose transaminase
MAMHGSGVALQPITGVPLIKADLPSLETLEPALRDMLASGRITNFGKHVAQFEDEAATYLGSHVATTSSGTMGLIFALQALGLERGRKVVLPSFTFMATAQAVLYAGGTPLFADIRDDLTVDAADLEQLLDRHDDVDIVIGVHMYGLPCQADDIARVVDAAERKRGRRIKILYDAAHAFGSSANGRRVGTSGQAEVFSLSVTKALVSVEGGMVSSRDAELIQRIKKMRNYGIEANYDAHYPGLNGKMSELHALVGLYNLQRLDGYMALRQASARYYSDRIRAATSFELVPWPDGVVHTFKDFTVMTPPALDGCRDEIIAELKEAGVETRAYFCPPVHEQRYFAQFSDRRLPRTERLARRVITLPFFTSITQDEMDFVVNALAQAEAKFS